MSALVWSGRGINNSGAVAGSGVAGDSDAGSCAPHAASARTEAEMRSRFIEYFPVKG
jgi:hypothetical protein